MAVDPNEARAEAVAADPEQIPLEDPPAGVEPIAPARQLAILAAIVGGAAVIWVVPAAGLILAWPFLFFIPGWLLVGRVAPGLPAPGRIGVAVTSSVYFSAHLANVVARVDGFGRLSVLVSVAALALASVVLVRFRHPWLAPPSVPSFAGVRSALREYRAAWAISLAIGLTVLALLAANGWRQTAAGFVSGGWNWSDFLVHVSIGSSIIHGNFPPQVPYFAGVPLTYHWFADFHGAIAATAAGLDVIPVFFLTSALFAAALAMLVWSLTSTLTGQARVATIATILICFGGGMGWLRLIGDLLPGGANVVDLLTNNSYDNSWAGDWPFFRIASLLSTGFLPHRATTLGLPGLVAAVLLLVNSVGRRPAGVLLAGILAAMLAPFHFYAFPATYVIVLLFVATTGAWRARTAIRDALLFLAPAVIAVPFIADAVIQQGHRGAFRLVLGWSEARFGDGPVAVVFFYLTNLGLPFLLAAVAVVLGRRMPAHRFLVAWMVVLFLIPNLLVASAVEFDMNKYFQIMWIAVCFLAAWLIRRWPRPIVATVILVSAISPVLVSVWQAWNPAVVLTTSQEAAAHWIERNTPDRSIFVTDAYVNSAVDLAGRLRISTFGPYAANLGYDPDQRGIDTKSVYCDGADTAARLMGTYGATYVLSSGGALDCGHDPTDFGSSPIFETVYDAGGVEVWHLRGP